MATPVYDIAAISTDTDGNIGAVFGGTETLGNTVNFGTFIHNTITAAGWTPIATATQNGRLNIEYIGVQPGYFDSDNVPSWYDSSQNIPWIQVLAGPSASTMNFKAGLYNGTTGTLTNTTNFTMRFISSNNRVVVWANPHQVFCRRLNTSDVHGTDSFFISAVHIPDFVWERNQVKTCIIATMGPNFNQRLYCDAVRVLTIYESNLGTGVQRWEASDSNFSPLMIHQGGGGGRAQTSSHRYVWNPTDTAMGTQSNWYPMISPATVAWDPITWTTSTLTATPQAMGMFWDCLYLNKTFPFGNVVEPLPESPDDKRLTWVILATADGDSTRQPGSLLFVTDTYTP